MNSGLEGRELFRDDGDRRRFIELLSQLEESFGIEIHAYCLMSNHYHLALKTPRGNLSEGMKWLGQSYTSGFNRRYDQCGTLFQGRFRSLPVDPEDWLYRLSLYIHLNPVKTSEFGLSKGADRTEHLGLGKAPKPKEITQRLKKLRIYRWSSFRSYAGYCSTPDWLRTTTILRLAARNSPDQKKEYRHHVSTQLKRGVEETVFEQFRNRVAVGSAGFVNRMKKAAQKVTRETEQRRRIKPVVPYGRILKIVEKVRDKPAREWLNRHGDSGKWKVLWLAKRYSGMTLSEMGNRTGGMDYAAVSIGIRRFENRMKREKALKKEMNELLSLLNIET